jgi:hypothetical protein
MQAKYKELTFADADVVNADAFIPKGEYNPHNVRPWLLHDHGFCLAIVFASCLQDALDEVADSGRLDPFQVTDPSDLANDEYMESVAYLGNASEPFDIASIDALELPNPPFSFTALFLAATAA